MIPVLSPKQAREFDRIAEQDCGIPSLLLMENAGRGAAEALKSRAKHVQCVRVVCGCGNNGGDGLVVARHLLSWGFDVRVALLRTRQELSSDAEVQWRAYRGIGGRTLEVRSAEDSSRVLQEFLQPAGLIVDALLGTGLNRPLEGLAALGIGAINEADAPAIALDAPSGLCCETGKVLGSCVRAAVTFTFGHPKTGLLTNQALALTGPLRVVALGVPEELGPGATPSGWALEPRDLTKWYGPRALVAHKSSAGRVLVLGGSRGKTGAALLTARAALRAGAGLVTIATFSDAAEVLEARVTEAMVRRLDPERIEATLAPLLEGADVAVIGPGLGLTDAARSLVHSVVFGWDGKVVVDADALTHCGRLGLWPLASSRRCLFTPHPGEMGRLLGQSSAQVESDRFGALNRAVERIGQTILLKGPHTLIGQPGKAPLVTSMGHPSLATAGAGDVLAGICASLGTQLPWEQAAPLAAGAHGRAAQLWADAHGGVDRGILASEVADGLPGAFASLAEVRSLLSV